MKHGIKLVTFIFLFSIILDSFLLAEDRIITSPLINLDEIKPSYEEQDTKNENISFNNKLKTRKNENQFKKSQVVLIGLDKITAKSSEIFIELNKPKKFGPLEIKILKCGKVKNDQPIMWLICRLKILQKMRTRKYLSLMAGLFLLIQI